MQKTFVCVLLLTIVLINHEVESQFSKCTNGEQCVSFHDCAPLKALTEKGRLTPEEKALIQSKQCNIINRELHVCCGGNTKSEKFTLPEPPVCGPSLSDRIFGGKITDIDEYPWLAQIQYSDSDGLISSHCGGSLINERFVLTAAHCDVSQTRKPYKLVQVRLGEWDTRTNPDCQKLVNEKICNDPYVEIPVAKIIIHEQYNPRARNQPNDIALLKLERNVEFTDFIRPICLPIQPNLRSKDYTSHSLEVAGFGRTETGKPSPVKLKVKLDVLSQSSCKDFFDKNRLSYSSTQLCAGGEEGKDSCAGDSGSSLMKFGLFSNSQNPYYMLVGIVSIGSRFCGTKSAPGIYTRVADYMDWISDNLK